jgi:tetratricopeptide (TPR) repeat protein
MTRFPEGKPIGKELPRPGAVALLLWFFAIAAWAGAAVALGAAILEAVQENLSFAELVLATGVFAGCAVLGVLPMSLALLLKYAFSAAVSAKLMERTLRTVDQKREGGQGTTELETASHQEVVSLLSEIMENTLIGEEEKSAKQQLAKKHRQQALRREIEALINAAKYRDAQDRLEEFRVRYADSNQVAELEARLSESLRQHEQTEIAAITDQIHRYMGLGLWERGMEMARALAEQYPENPDAARLPETVRLEQEGNQRQEQQRLYREIEHLAARRHWRQALRVAESLLQKHPDSPEAHTLAGQVEELRRNAAVMERREWETRIAEHVQTGRHREAYNLAVELMEKYPESPQAQAIRERLDQLKARAGVTE